MTKDKRKRGLNLPNFLLKHLRPRAWAKGRKQKYSVLEIIELLQLTKNALQCDGSLAIMSPPCFIVGDIHGQYRELGKILFCQMDSSMPVSSPFSKNRFVFLGDYIDRGQQSIETICTVFALKCSFPRNIILLRGNHETYDVNSIYGFKDDIYRRFESDAYAIFEMFNEVFNWLPLACLIGGRILCVHGGISPHLNSLDDIRNIGRPLTDVSCNKLAFDLLWSDPLDFDTIHAVQKRPVFTHNRLRGVSYAFNEAAVEKCIDRLNVDLIVRSHRMTQSGFRFFSNRKMITIFSAPNYGCSGNKGAFLRVLENGSVGIILMTQENSDSFDVETETQTNTRKTISETSRASRKSFNDLFIS